jgi:uncharacterized protein (DUF58 family)
VNRSPGSASSRDRRISPASQRSRSPERGTVLFTWRSGALFAGIALLWLVSGISPLLVDAAIAANLGGLLLIYFDLKGTVGCDSLSAERIHDPQLSLGAENEITLRIRSRVSVEMRAEVRDRPPLEMDSHPAPFRVALGPLESKDLAYVLVPTERGEYRFGNLWARREGRLGFIVRQWAIPMERTVKVYPNVLAARKYETLLTRSRRNETGLRSVRSPGAGKEFAAMRDYQPDDEFRSIDWNATARRVKLIVREYEAERNQRAMIVLDCGRMMSAPVALTPDREDGLSEAIERRMAGGSERELRMTKLDFAVNAALIFSYVALGLGDLVGMLTFTDAAGEFLPPDRGEGQLRRILEGLYRVQASTLDSSYPDVYLQLQNRLRRRSLLLFFTDLMDRESSQSAIRYMGLLARRHLCVCIAIGDPEVAEWAGKTPSDDEEVYRQAVALSALRDRAVALNELRRMGVRVVDALPESLTAEAVRRYLEAKRRGAI